MIRPDDRQLLAMASVALSEDGKVVVALINQLLADTKDQLIHVVAESQLLRTQGRAAALKELVEALEKAPDLVSKRNRRT